MVQLDYITPKVSVVIPVYNAGKYLQKTIDSIVSQSFTGWEMILVDDGSKDESGRICDEQTDKRIKVFHKKNGGVSSARNYGLRQANGEYIAFIDADDYVDPDYLCSLLDGDGSDFVIMGYWYDNRTEIAPPKKGQYTWADIRENINDFLNTDHFCFPWARLFKKEIIESFNISFNENMRFAEDHVFNWTYLQYVKSLYISGHSLYHKNTVEATKYNLSFKEIDMIDGQLFHLLSNLNTAFELNIHPHPQTFFHIAFQDDCISSYTVSEYVDYWYKYHSNSSKKDAYSNVATYSFYPALQQMKKLKSQSDFKRKVVELDAFMDSPWSFVWYANAKSRLIVPFIKLGLYRLVAFLLRKI